MTEKIVTKNYHLHTGASSNEERKAVESMTVLWMLLWRRKKHEMSLQKWLISCYILLQSCMCRSKVSRSMSVVLTRSFSFHLIQYMNSLKLCCSHTSTILNDAILWLPLPPSSSLLCHDVMHAVCIFFIFKKIIKNKRAAHSYTLIIHCSLLFNTIRACCV